MCLNQCDCIFKIGMMYFGSYSSFCLRVLVHQLPMNFRFFLDTQIFTKWKKDDHKYCRRSLNTTIPSFRCLSHLSEEQLKNKHATIIFKNNNTLVSLSISSFFPILLLPYHLRYLRQPTQTSQPCSPWIVWWQKSNLWKQRQFFQKKNQKKMESKCTNQKIHF